MGSPNACVGLLGTLVPREHGGPFRCITRAGSVVWRISGHEPRDEDWLPGYTSDHLVRGPVKPPFGLLSAAIAPIRACTSGRRLRHRTTARLDGRMDAHGGHAPSNFEVDRATRWRSRGTCVSGQRANRLLMRRDWTMIRFALRGSASNERGSMLSTGTNATRAQPRMPCARVAHDCLLSVDASRKICVLHV